MRVLVRADATPAAGTGHVMRCLALAAALRRHGADCILLSTDLPPPLASRAAEVGVVVRPMDPGASEAQATLVAAHETGASWVVSDAYEPGAHDHAAIRAAGLRLLVIDDAAILPRYDADLVLNQNAYATRDSYAGRTGAERLLLGSRYALLRPEFAAYRDWRREVGQRVTRVLVTLGGSDPSGATATILRGLRGVERSDLRIDLLVGGANQHVDELRAAAAADPRAELSIDAHDVPERMAQADLAIATAGTTGWELAFMQLPSLLVVGVPNQAAVAASLVERGTARSLGEASVLHPAAVSDAVLALDGDAATRAAMAGAGRELIDGRGADRVARAMLVAGVGLRPAGPDDMRMLWAWSNDPATRAASFASTEISWDDHRAWYAARLADPATLFLVAVDGGTPVGQVRFLRLDGTAVISVSVALDVRGRGYAPAIIDRACRTVFEAWPVDRVRADIKEENVASIAAFEEAGFGDRTHFDAPAPALSLWRTR